MEPMVIIKSKGRVPIVIFRYAHYAYNVKNGCFSIWFINYSLPMYNYYFLIFK